MKDKHKLWIALLLLIIIVILTISTLLKTPLNKSKKVLQNELGSNSEEIQSEQMIEEND
jgi:flagellar basal body-associated protein FliL